MHFLACRRAPLSTSAHNVICGLPSIYSHTNCCEFIRSSFRTVHSRNVSSSNMSNLSTMLGQTDFSLFYGPSVDESIDTVTSYVRFCYDIFWFVEKLLIYPQKISFPLLKRLGRKKEYYFRLNDFSNVNLISSNIQAKIDRLNCIFTSRLSNCKPSQLWNNIRSIVLVPTKRNIPKF